MTISQINQDGAKLAAFIAASFLAMAMASYFYVSTVMKRQIDLYSQSEMKVAQLALKSLIQAHEDALWHSAASISLALEHKAGPEELLSILTAMTASFRSQRDIKNVFMSVYAYLDGTFMDGSGLIPGQYFNPKTASWLRGAILLEPGQFYHTEPYIDPRTGQVVSAVSMVVFDKSGESRGVIAIDYLLTPVIERVEAYKVSDTGYAILANRSLSILTFPDPAYKGRKLRDVPGYQEVSARLEKLGDEVSVELLNSRGQKSIGFFSRLDNGWYLGLVAPVRFYYREVFGMMPIMGALALALSTILSFIAIRLNSAKARSEEESRSKSTFLARMSHEIRTPMNAIIGLSELAIRDYGMKEGRKYISEIKKAGNNLLNIINDILDFSKIESGKLTINAAPYQTANLLSDVVSLMGPRLQEKSLEFIADISPLLPRALVGDETSIRQVMINLLSNALKYTPKGFVKFAVAASPGPERSLRLEISVEDSGIGIKPEHQENLFGDFVRLEAGKRSIEGTGLGLSITRGLCRMMGGDVSLESRFGEGSTFKATMLQEVADPEPLGDFLELGQERESAKAEPGFAAPGLKVLVVDDIETNLMVAKGLLSPYQGQTTLCLSGHEAIEATEREVFDLLLIDHMMPGMDGIETLRKIRERREEYRHVPAIAFTANAIIGVREMLLEKGFDDYISKPVETHKLTALMDKWTPSRLRRYKQKDLSPENKGEPGLAAGKNDKEIQREKERKLPEGFSLSEAMEAALDVNLGLRRCGGSPKNYLSLLSVFMKDALATEKELYLPEPGQEDLPLIATRIHAIKSAAASLGAEALSKEAAFLEERARIGDIETLRRGRLEAFRRDLSALAAGLKEALDRFNSQNRLEEIPLGIDGLILLKEAVAGKKIREIDSLIARYSQSCGTDGRAALESLSGLILIGDFIQAESYLEGLIKNIRP